MIGQRIKELRKEQKLTQQDLSKGIITRSYLSQIEQGLVLPSFDVLEKLSKRLNCSVDDFYKTVENKDLLLSQIKREIKTAENHVNTKAFEKVEDFIKKDYLTNDDLNYYDKGILNWINGKYYEYKKDYRRAISFFQDSVAEFEKGKSSVEVLRSLDSLGYAYSRVNENEKALHILNKAYRMMIYDQIGGLIRISILVNLGIVHGKLNEYYSAINFLQNAMDLNTSEGTYYKSGEIFMALGVCNMELKRYKEAKEFYEMALKYFKLNGNEYQEAGTYTNLGILYAYQSEYEEAQTYLHTAIKIYKMIKAERSKILNAQVELLRVHVLRGEYTEATSLCQEIIEFDGDNKFKAYAFEILGDIKYEFKDNSASLKHYDEAISILDSQSLPCDFIYKKIADIFCAEGQYQKAADYYKKCF